MSELAAFNKLFSDYKERFIRFAYNYVRDVAIAEDFVIDSIVYYWERRHELRDETNIPAYVLTTLKHKCLNHLKHQQIAFQVADKIQSHMQWELNTRIATLEACEPYELFSIEIQEIINDVLRKMPKRTRQIFEMSRFQNMSHQEIATELGITKKGVEFHISKALKELRIGLGDYLNILILILYFM